MSETAAMGIVFIFLGAITCLTNRAQGRIIGIYLSGWKPTQSGRYPIPIFCGVVGMIWGVGMIVLSVLR